MNADCRDATSRRFAPAPKADVPRRDRAMRRTSERPPYRVRWKPSRSGACLARDGFPGNYPRAISPSEARQVMMASRRLDHRGRRARRSSLRPVPVLLLLARIPRQLRGTPHPRRLELRNGCVLVGAGQPAQFEGKHSARDPSDSAIGQDARRTVAEALGRHGRGRLRSVAPRVATPRIVGGHAKTSRAGRSKTARRVGGSRRSCRSGRRRRA